MVSQQYSNGDVFTQISDVTKPLSHTYNYYGEESSEGDPLNKQETLITPLVLPHYRSPGLELYT